MSMLKVCALTLVFAVLAAVPAGVGIAAAGTITEWDFENQSQAVNNSPAPSTGAGTAIVLGMTNSYPTPNPSVAMADIYADTDPGNSDPANQQVWRIRGVPVPPSGGAANGWYSGAPQYSQGAEFDVSTAGFSGIKVSFDWEATKRGVENIELQYNTNVNNSAGWTNLGYYTAVAASTFQSESADLTGISGVSNDPNFGIRIVSAYNQTTGTYLDTTGAPLNDSSGNIRIDNAVISGAVRPRAGLDDSRRTRPGIGHRPGRPPAHGLSHLVGPIDRMPPGPDRRSAGGRC